MHIAIAIPTLNRSEKLKKALDSIFAKKQVQIFGSVFVYLIQHQLMIQECF